MKKINYFLCLLLFSTNSIAAEDGSGLNLGLLAEEYKNTKARGIALYQATPIGKNFMADVGISFNYIKSDIPLERAERREIFPIYVFANFALNYSISPFVGLGFDLGDAMLDKSHEGQTSEVDIYYMVGIKTQIKKSLNFSVYAKRYELFFNEIDDPALQNVSLDMVGASVSVNF